MKFLSFICFHIINLKEMIWSLGHTSNLVGWKSNSRVDIKDVFCLSGSYKEHGIVLFYTH